MEAQRYPISVRFVGVMHKEKSKMYMTSVLWSDQNDIVVYRTFGDFKKLHKQLKKAFPAGSKLKKSDRIIPKFRGRRTKRSQKKAPTKSMMRLKFLQKYCNELLSCDPRVLQSQELTQFFQPKEQDLQPEFARNSIMIMPSEDEMRTDAGHGNGGNVTQPFVTETYRCVAPYETKDTKNKPFKVAVDEKVDVLIKDKAGWWLVENEEKRMAWFPAPYLEKLDDEDEDEDDSDGIPERGMRYTAVKSYKATKDDEITVSIGAVVEVLQKSDNGWWLIRYNGKAGYIPTMYLQPYSYPQIRMTSHHQERRASSVLPLPSSMLERSQELSRSQGNLLQVPPVGSSSPHPLQPHTKERSHSLDIPPEQPPAPPARSTFATNVAVTAKHSPPPTIMVQRDEEEEQRGRRLSGDSEGSFESSGSDLSYDDLSSSSASSSFNLSHGANDERLRFSRTPPPTLGNHLSPTSGLEGKIMPSVSDPNLYKRPTTPKVPPRPQAQEILTRCSTVTRKNATKGNLSPTQAEILSR